MSEPQKDEASSLLTFLEQLLRTETSDLRQALTQAAQLIVEALSAEKVDIFLYEQERQTLVAMGVSQTALGRREQALGLDQLALANGGRGVEVFQTGTSYRNGHIEDDPEELRGVKEGLHVRSILVVPVENGTTRQGIIQVDSTQPEVFTEQDQQLLEGIAQWIGLVIHRAELLQRVTSDAAEQARRGTAEGLVTVLAHDLRNYLTPLQGRLDLLYRRALREQRERDITDLVGIRLAVRRFDKLIADLLDTARLSQGLLTLTCQQLDLTALVQEMVMALGSPSVRVEIEMPAHLSVWADAPRLQQALENVLANALKHTLPDRMIRIEAHEEQEEKRVVLSVTDQGPGIPPEERSSLFELFHAGKGSSGLGLGLHLAAQIVAAHRGALWLDESYQQGARFVFSLPTPMPELPSQTATLPDRSAPLDQNLR